LIDLESEVEMHEVEVENNVNETTASIISKMKPTQIGNRIAMIETDLAKLRDDITTRRIQDSLVTARIREELDFTANIRKEDKMIITGLTSKVPMPSNLEEKKKWQKDIVGKILNQIVPEAAEQITFINMGRKNSNYIPVAEVTMANREIALNVRKQFSVQKRAGKDFGKAYIANSVTLATRVRVDILKAMAKQYATEGVEMYVSAFSSRPMLHVRPKEEGGRSMALTFSDALGRYGSGMNESELGEAYRRAGAAFRGQLQQNFVVLHEGHANGGEKRKAEGDAAAVGAPAKTVKKSWGSGRRELPTATSGNQNRNVKK
jgi:hypothetical protein